MPYLADIKTAFPENYYNQKELFEGLKSVWEGQVKNQSRIASIHENVLVKGRHLALPLKKYLSKMTFDERNDHFIKEAVNLAEKSIRKLLQANDLKPSDISSIWSNTVTGFAIPSLEARVMNRLDFRPNTKRVPLVGLGCMAGAAGINRVSDYLKAYPDEAVIFFSVELCSLTLQLEDTSVANLISTGLFGDGAAAVLMVGEDHPLAKSSPLKWLASESVFFPDSEDVMGWEVGRKGLKIILNKNVPQITENNLPGPLDSFLEKQKLSLGDVDSFFAHPGGPKVLLAMEKVLDLPKGGLSKSWESLGECGNMSSVSVLDIFERTLGGYEGQLKGKYAMSLAMGPAFSAELGLFQWNK